MLCSYCGRGLLDGGLTCGACGAPVTRSGGTGVPAPPLPSRRSPGARARRRAAPLVAGVALLVTMGIGVAALAAADGDGDGDGDGQGGGETLGLEEPGAGGGGFGSTGEGTDDGGGAAAQPSLTQGTAAPPIAEGYVALPSGGDWAGGVDATFEAYFGGINSQDPQSAWMQLSPRQQQRTHLDDFAESVRTSYDDDFVVHDASYADGRAHVWLEFTSTQDPALGPAPGEDCTRWSLDYVLLEQPDGRFLIDEVAGRGGTTGHSPCQ